MNVNCINNRAISIFDHETDVLQTWPITKYSEFNNCLCEFTYLVIKYKLYTLKKKSKGISIGQPLSEWKCIILTVGI